MAHVPLQVSSLCSILLLALEYKDIVYSMIHNSSIKSFDTDVLPQGASPGHIQHQVHHVVWHSSGQFSYLSVDSVLCSATRMELHVSLTFNP